MRTFLYATAAIALLAAPAAHADERTNAGAVTGGAAGAATGAVIGGPIGAAVGGVAGAAIGAATAVPRDVRTYVVEHPVDSVSVEGDLSEGYQFPDTVTIHRIPHHPSYGYVYVHDRPVVVRMHSRKIVYAAAGNEARDRGTTAAISRNGPPERVITYVEKHRVEPVTIERRVRVGAVLPDSVELTPVPDDPDYAYVYVDHGPVLVRRDTRKVIWMR